MVSRRLVPDVSPSRAGFDPRSFHVAFVMDKVARGRLAFADMRTCPVSFILPVAHTHNVSLPSTTDATYKTISTDTVVKS